ncbi:MAG: hypothetical protein EOO04_04530 [Chitinophagaceae bacterium]|nr:MAG: hypothetical protein EOO04_04530 [Chitinophagaceae bacterium]
MKAIPSLVVLTVVGTVLFNLVFWNESTGINFLVFSGFIVLAICKTYPSALKHRLSVLTLAAHLVSIALIIIHGTGLSAVSAMITLFLFAAFSAHSHRSVAFATGTMLLQTIYLPATCLAALCDLPENKLC